jgi:hypothetical protein
MTFYRPLSVARRKSQAEFDSGSKQNRMENKGKFE